MTWSINKGCHTEYIAIRWFSSRFSRFYFKSKIERNIFQFPNKTCLGWGKNTPKYGKYATGIFPHSIKTLDLSVLSDSIKNRNNAHFQTYQCHAKMFKYSHDLDLCMTIYLFSNKIWEVQKKNKKKISGSNFVCETIELGQPAATLIN